MMKRIIAFMLVVMLVLSMAGCSGGDEQSNGGTETGSGEVANNAGNSGANYTLYDDLPNYERIPFREIYISTPAWRSDYPIIKNCLRLNVNRQFFSWQTTGDMF